jgi:hypothetical protein
MTNKKYTNKRRGKCKKKKCRTLKMCMKGGARKPVCDELTELGNNNIFQVFKSAIQLPKMMFQN